MSFEASALKPQAIKHKTGLVTVEWQPIDVSSYIVYKSVNGSGYELLSSTTELSAVDYNSSADSGVVHYKVSGIGGTSAGAYSPIRTVVWGFINPWESVDTQKIYVALSGDDANDGLSPSSAVSSISRAKTIYGTGGADHIYFNRGDDFRSQGQFSLRNFYGRSELEPTVISWYGDTSLPRPKVHKFFQDNGNYLTQNLIIKGIDVSHDPSIGNSGGVTILASSRALSGGSKNIIIQDILGLSAGGSMQGESVIADSPIDNLYMSHMIIKDTASSGSHAQGYFITYIHGLVIEDCVFDHNGWREGEPGFEATIFNHNLYIQYSNWEVQVRDSILSRAASHGIHFRPGGICDGNVFLQNAINLQMGYSWYNVSAYYPSGATGIIRDNVILDGRDINGSSRTWGIYLTTLSSIEVSGNIVAFADTEPTGGSAQSLSLANDGDFEPISNPSPGVDNAYIHDNIIYDYGEPYKLGSVEDRNDNVSLYRNDIYLSGAEEVLEVVASSVLSSLSISGNRYYSTDATPFNVTGTAYTFSEASAILGDTGSTFELFSSTYPYPEKRIDDYATQIGNVDPSLSGFLASALILEETNWDSMSDYHTSSVRSYFRENFGLDAALPTIGTVSIVGSLTGEGPLPLHWRADIEESSWDPGTGTIWPKGRWEFDVIDNSTGSTYVPSVSRDRMTLTCPTSGKTATAFNRYGAAPNAGCVLRDEGTYTPRLRYQNEYGNWSSWVSGSTVTVSAFTGTTLYCRGSNGSDSNDGLSFANAKASLSGVLGAVSADNTKVILYDDETIDCTSGVDLADFSGIYITRSYDGTDKPVITYNTSLGAPFILANDSVLEGVNIVSGTGGSGRCITVVNSARGGDNVFIVNVDFSGVGSFIEDGGTRNAEGLGIYGGTQTGRVNRYCIYTETTSSINILGVDWKQGCHTEHTIRTMDGKYYSIDYSDIIYSTGSTAKTALRVACQRFFGAYRSAWDGGSISIANGDAWVTGHYTEDVRFDCCRLSMVGEEDDSIARKLSVYETARRIVFASTTQYRKSSLNNPAVVMGDRSGIVGDLADIWWINCYCYNRRFNSVDTALGATLELNERTDVNMSGLHFINTVIMTEDDAIGAAYQDLIIRDTSPSADGSEFRNCVLFDHSSIDHDIYQDDFGYARSASALNALGDWASDNVDGRVYINPDTLEILSGQSYVTGIATDTNGVFESITAPAGYSTELDKTLTSWEAGPVQTSASLSEAAGPTTGAVTLVGGTSGMAPFPVHWYADIEASASTWATNSGAWPEGRWEFEVIDNGTGEVYSPSLSRNAMVVTCPTNGHSQSAYDRFGAVGYAGAVIWDAGSYTCRLRYQNRDGTWSAWADSSTITVVADSRTEIHCRGTNGSDSNDGLSFANAKATLSGALSVIAGDQYKVILYDDETISSAAETDLSTRSDIWVTRSYDGTNPPKVTRDAAGVAFVVCDNMVVDGIDFVYDSVTNYSILGYSGSNSITNVAICNTKFEESSSFVEVTDAATGGGLLLYNCTQEAVITRYCIYNVALQHVSVLGCDWQFGSSTESTLRIGHSSGAPELGQWHAVDFCTLAYASVASKDVLRLYSYRFAGVYRTSMASGVVQLGFNVGGVIGFSDYRMDCCRYTSDTGGTSQVEHMSICEGMQNLSLASCSFYRDNRNNNPTLQAAHTSEFVGSQSNIRALNVNFRNTAGGIAGAGPLSFTSVVDATFEDWKVKGCLIQSDDTTMADAWRTLFTAENPADADTEFRECVIYDNQTLTSRVYSDGVNNPTDASSLNALGSWVSDNVDGNITFDKDTAAITSGTEHQNLVSSIQGVFESITAGTGYTTEIDRTVGTWDAGAVQRDSMLIAETVSSGSHTFSADITLPLLSMAVTGTNTTPVTLSADITLPSLSVNAAMFNWVNYIPPTPPPSSGGAGRGNLGKSKTILKFTL